MSHYTKDETGRLRRIYSTFDRRLENIAKGGALEGGPLECATNFLPEVNKKGVSTLSRVTAAELTEWASYIGRGGHVHLPRALTVARAALMIEGTPKDQFDKGFSVYERLFTKYAKREPKAADTLLRDHQAGLLPCDGRELKMKDGALDKGRLLKAFRAASLHLHSADVVQLPIHANQPPVVGMTAPAELAAA